MKNQEIEKYASALLRWDAAYAAEHAARRAEFFAQLGDKESASDWQRIQKLTANPKKGASNDKEASSNA